MILVTGGAGFIGSNFVLEWLARGNESVVVLDLLTYAGSLSNLDGVARDPRFHFICGDIGDSRCVDSLLRDYRPRAIINLAAESHVDRSIEGPVQFVQTNVVSLTILLQSSYRFWNELPSPERFKFRFLNVSTDEVYGSLNTIDDPCDEFRPYRPSNPYAASKAAGDHMANAFFSTYGLPVITTHCSNNFGPRQFPEKLIPLLITRALNRQSLPIYGDGEQVRDWIYVSDHCDALRQILATGVPGDRYNIGATNEYANNELVWIVCALLDRCAPLIDGGSYRYQMKHVEDRKGHDRRYAVDAMKLQRELRWVPQSDFEAAMEKTVAWYLAERNVAKQDGEAISSAIGSRSHWVL